MEKLSKQNGKNDKKFPPLLSILPLILFFLSIFFVLQHFLYNFYKKKDYAVLPIPNTSFATVKARSLDSQKSHLRGGSGIKPVLDLDVPKNPIFKPSPTTRGPRLANYKQTLKLSQRQKEIAVGVMLGDASLQTQDKGRTFRLKFQGSVKHSEYSKNLYKEFEDFCLSQPHTFDRVNENNNIVESWGFQTLSHQEFDYIAKVFCNEDKLGTKVIKPKLVEEFVTPTALAYWFMDDGSKMDHTINEGKGIVLNTQGFQENEVENLCEGLKKRYGFQCWKGKNKGKFVVKISGNSYEEFVKIVKPELVPSMLYKLPSERKRLRRHTL